MERWLSLTVSNSDLPKTAKKPLFLISVPKKTVKQAVKRNRIKRVLREALRGSPFLPEGKVHRFKVLKSPENVGLRMAQEAVRELLGRG